jgi:hypothetical protein
MFSIAGEEESEVRWTSDCRVLSDRFAAGEAIDAILDEDPRRAAREET